MINHPNRSKRHAAKADRDDAAIEQRRKDFSRPVYLHVCKDGTVSYRRAGQKVFNGRALPVFTVDNEEQAVDMQVRFCRRQWVDHPQMKPGEGWYKLNEFSGEMDDLDRVADMFREFYNQHLAAKAA